MDTSIILNEAGVVTLVDLETVERLNGKKPYLGLNGYAYLSFWRDASSHPVSLHSWIMGPQQGMHIDHSNGDKLDNRRDNLRVVTFQANQVNRKQLNRNNVSGVRGVSRFLQSSKETWRAQIMVNRRNLHLGLFASKEEAIAARKVAELKYYGELCP